MIMYTPFLKLRQLFSVDVGHPIFSATMSFNRNKGLHFRSLGSFRPPYNYYTVSYTGKPVEVTKSYIKVTLTIVKRIIEDFEQHGYSLKGTNISMDCYYTSIPLSEWLYEKNIICIGTLN